MHCHNSDKRMGDDAMSKIDEIYKNIVLMIQKEGEWNYEHEVRARYGDGTPAYTKSIFGYQYRIRPEDGVPLITSRRVPIKTAYNEVMAFYRDKTNKIDDLHALGIKYWDEWVLPDGTIGKSYGYQIKNQTYQMPDGRVLDQMDYVLDQLKNSPGSRRIMTSFWKPEEVHEKALQECAYETMWEVRKGKLYLHLFQRSCDVALGFIANTYQYNMLQRVVAHVLGYELGDFVHSIVDLHIYDRHLEQLIYQVTEHPTFDAPEVQINPRLKDFYKNTWEDIEIVNYQYGPQLKYEIAE